LEATQKCLKSKQKKEGMPPLTAPTKTDDNLQNTSDHSSELLLQFDDETAIVLNDKHSLGGECLMAYNDKENTEKNKALQNLPEKISRGNQCDIFKPFQLSEESNMLTIRPKSTIFFAASNDSKSPSKPPILDASNNLETKWMPCGQQRDSIAFWKNPSFLVQSVGHHKSVQRGFRSTLSSLHGKMTYLNSPPKKAATTIIKSRRKRGVYTSQSRPLSTSGGTQSFQILVKPGQVFGLIEGIASYSDPKNYVRAVVDGDIKALPRTGRVSELIGAVKPGHWTVSRRSV
jgi:hypothetical protein